MKPLGNLRVSKQKSTRCPDAENQQLQQLVLFQRVRFSLGVSTPAVSDGADANRAPDNVQLGTGSDKATRYNMISSQSWLLAAIPSNKNVHFLYIGAY